jgi:HK97 family phage portal protein
MAIQPLHPMNVLVERKDGQVTYYVNQDGEKSKVEEGEMLHFPMPGFDGLRSPSVIHYAAMQTIGTALRTEDHAARLFESGAASRVALEIPGTVKPEIQKALQEAWLDSYGSSSDTRRFPLVLQGGTKASTISLTAADAQLLETRRFHVEDIARSFGVPPWMIGAMDKQTSWGSGVEQAGIGFVVYTLNPHLHRIQNELTRKLLPKGPAYLEFAVEGLMQGDLKAQSDYMRQALGGSQGPGWMTLNEIRRLKNLSQIAGGDEIYMPKADGASNANSNPTGG